MSEKIVNIIKIGSGLVLDNPTEFISCRLVSKIILKLTLRNAIHTHFVTLIGKWTMSFLPIHPVFLSALYSKMIKLLKI